MFNTFIGINRHLFSTLALAEHNGKNVTKNTLKLLTAAHKFGEDVQYIIMIDSYIDNRKEF